MYFSPPFENSWRLSTSFFWMTISFVPLSFLFPCPPFHTYLRLTVLWWSPWSFSCSGSRCALSHPVFSFFFFSFPWRVLLFFFRRNPTSVFAASFRFCSATSLTIRNVLNVVRFPPRGGFSSCKAGRGHLYSCFSFL